MSTVKQRVSRLEASMGQPVPDHLRVDPHLHWACHVRDGYEKEDYDEACRRAGIRDPGGITLVGIIPKGQEPVGFMPSIERIQIHGPWKGESHAIA
ncbi:hypothetical protein [Aureimonas psammosilenae]|uniref:hypothetical protein n=1 Tax=Aureimonas psammosilenae TaxID=2495496 RepID=UPI00126041FF|nr:hypothetical protein [Aureimonas psammosilenae]